MPAVVSPRYPSLGYSLPSPNRFAPRHFMRSMPGLLVSAKLVVCALLLGFACRPIPAQGPQGSNNLGDRNRAMELRMRQLEELGNDVYERDGMSRAPVQRSQPTCLLHPYPGLAKMVSVHSLEIPEKVQSEYNKACTALQSQKLADAEKHLRKALQRSSVDALGWVMLGRILELTNRLDEAREACSQAALHEPSYWPATVCLAEIDSRMQKWSDSLAESNRAVSLSQESKRFAYYIGAIALFNLNKRSDAESRALEAERLDGAHEVLPLRLLLAQFAEVRGDLQGAANQLRDCVSNGNNSPEGKSAKLELARLGIGPN